MTRVAAAALATLTMTLEAAVVRASSGDPDSHRGVRADADSFTCLACHDGSMAREGSGHPIDVSYGVASLAVGARLRASSALPTAVRLERGRVGCTSCHDLRSPLPAKLVLSNAGSKLCFACHEL